MPNNISCFSYPKVSSQKTNGIDSIISQVKERHAQHESSSKALQKWPKYSFKMLDCEQSNLSFFKRNSMGNG
jgi:hypothetical protein